MRRKNTTEQVFVWSGSKKPTKNGVEIDKVFFFSYQSVRKKKQNNKRQSQVAQLLWQQLHADQPFFADYSVVTHIYR